MYDYSDLKPAVPATSRTIRGPGRRFVGRVLFAGILGLWLTAVGSPVGAQGKGEAEKAGKNLNYQVIIHADNPAQDLAASVVARMFRKKLKRWEHGVEVVPVDLGVKSAVRKDFSEGVHGRSITAIKSFWQRMIFSGNDVPPEEKTTESDVIAFVRNNAGAIGYVSADASLGSGVKVLKVTP